MDIVELTILTVIAHRDSRISFMFIMKRLGQRVKREIIESLL